MGSPRSPSDLQRLIRNKLVNISLKIEELGKENLLQKDPCPIFVSVLFGFSVYVASLLLLEHFPMPLLGPAYFMTLIQSWSSIPFGDELCIFFWKSYIEMLRINFH